MLVNADFNQRAVVHAKDVAWVSSPIAGIERRMLDRVGDEVARATSLVRYAAGKQFSPHVHDGGEEFLVLEGVFQDEYGDFPAGSYVRNPPESKHTPRSDGGCVIFVKLWQFDLSDRTQVRLRPEEGAARKLAELEGVSAVLLFRDQQEEVRIEEWQPLAELPARQHAGGLELLVLDGQFEDSGVAFEKYSWMRLPPGETFAAKVGPRGAKVWMKMGHLSLEQLGPAQRRAG